MKLAVVGDPVAHSRSPFLHGNFLHEAGIRGTYEAIRVEAGTLAARLPELRRSGYVGLNVTTPLKEEAFALCRTADDAATFARSANTLWFDREGVVGANTDGIGAVAAVRAARRATPDVTGAACADPAAGALVLLLGAGPTSRAAALSLASDGFRLALWSRRPEPARELAAALALESDARGIFVFDALRARTAGVDDAPWPDACAIDAIFSTVPPDVVFPPALASLLGFVPCVIDANYGRRATLGRKLGRTDVADGSVMLEAQARASFALWTSPDAPWRRGGDSNSRDR